MNAKERFDACMKIAQYGAKNFHGRREFEWKVTLGFWALIVGAIVLSQQKQNPFVIFDTRTIWFISIGALLGFAFLWLRSTWVANENDKRLAHHFLFAGERIIRNPRHIPKNHPPKISLWSRIWWFGFLSDWSPWFQLFTSALLLTAFCLLAK